MLEAGSETKVLLRHFPSPPRLLPTGGSNGVTWGEPQRLCPSVCRDRCTGLVAGMSKPRICSQIPETPTSLVFSASAPFFSPPSSPLWWGEVCCSQLCRNAVRVHEITSLNPGPTRPRSGISIKLFITFLWPFPALSPVVSMDGCSLTFLPASSKASVSLLCFPFQQSFSDCLRLQSKYSQWCLPSVLLKPWFRNSILISLKKKRILI